MLRDEEDKLENRHSGFWCSLVQVALNCQNISQKACYGCEKFKKSNPDPNFFMTDENFGGSV